MIGIFLVSSASASDLNGTAVDDLGSLSDEDDISIGVIENYQENYSDDKLSQNGDCEIISANYTPKDASEIQTCVNTASADDTIILDGYYLINKTISVKRNLNFLGQNDATIEGNFNARLVSISGECQVTFKNITFKNSNGGVISLYDGDIVVENCTFINNSANDGGAIYSASYCSVNVINCAFINNSARFGGAIDAEEYLLTIKQSKFINNSAGSSGGAIYHQGIHRYMGWVYQYDYYGKSIEDSIFVNNSAGSSGGALYLTASDSIRNCTFNENHALNSGGAICAAIYYSGKLPRVIVSDSIFNNNNASNAGAIYHSGNQYIKNSIFNNNTASENGAIFTKGSIINCSFINSLVNSFLSADNMVVSLGNDIILTANLSSPLGVLSNRLVIFSVNGKDYTVNTDNEGLAILNVTDELKDVGQYNISIKFGGDDTFANSYEYFTIMLLKSNEVLGNTFLSIQSAIDFSDDYDTIIVDGYYFNDINSPIVVSKQLTFIGINNAILDSKGISRIVNINSTNVTFINITFKNGYGKSNGWKVFYGGAIQGQCNVLNCVFVNNTGGAGGAMYGGSAVNCTFINNYADNSGGAIYDGSAVNCTFINNSAWKYGGAMYGGSAVNCSFTSNSVTSESGGAIYGGSAVNCSFSGNSDHWGVNAIYKCSALDCIFDKYPSNNYYYTSCLNVNDLTIFNDENVFLSANLSNILGSLFSKVITFNIGGIEYNVTTDSQGVAYLNVRNYLTEYGSYNVMVSYEGDDVNLPVSKNITVTIVNYNTNLEVNNLTVNIGEGVLIASLSDMSGQLYGKTVTFTIEGIEHNVTTDSDGLAKININDFLTQAGNYSIDVNFDGDEANSPVSAIAHVVINKYNPILDVDDLSIIQGEDGFLEVRLSDARGILTNKRIKFTINGNDYYGTTDLNGVAKLNIKDILTQLGSYTVNVSFEGDDSINHASKVINVLINSLKANLTVRQDGIYYGDTNLTFRLINSKTNGPISGAIINLAFSNGISINITTDAQGIASYEIPFIPGIYNLTAKVINMDYSDINTIRLNDLTVSKFRGQIELTQTDDCRALKVKLYNPDTGDVFKNLTVILKFSTGRTVSIITDGEGVSQYYMDFNEGEYSLIASVDNQFSEFENASLGNIIINNKENSEVDFSWHVLEFDYLSAGEIFVIVKGGTVNIDDISVLNQPDAQITFKNNKITVSNLTAGNHVLSVKTTPDASHNSISRTLDIKVNKIYSALNMIDSTSFDYGDSANINLDFDGCDISKDNIYVIGHPEAIISFEDNVLTVSNLPAGEYTLSVTTVPDSNHMAVTRNVSITVNKVESDITFDDSIAFDWGSYSPINVYLKGCTFKFNDIEVIDHSEAVIRVSSNMIRISNLTVGDYKLRVTTTPDENHKSVTRSVDFTVNKLPSTLNFNRAVSFKYGTYGFTTIDFSDCDILKDDICIINHPEAIIDYEDKFITVSNLEVGTYILSVTTTPNDNYQSVTRILEVNVNKVDSDIIFSNELNFDYLQSDSVFMTLQGCTVEYENISVVNHTEANITFEDNIVTVSNLNPGNYVLCINTTPDENHNSVTRYLNITVNKIASSINFTTDEIAFDEGSLGSTSVNVNGCNISKECIIVENHPEAVINVTGNMITVSNLTAGNYILRATTNPDENHSSVIRSIYVVVSKIPAKVNFTKDTVIFDYGGVGTVGVIVDGGFVLPKDINVLNYPKTEVYIDNNNDIRIYGLDAGDYTLCVITTPDENHRAFENYINITVNKVNSTINFKNNISFEYGNVGTVEVSVDGGNLLSANVVNHTEADVRVGINQISVSNLNVGRYTLNVTSASDNNHYATSTNLDIIVLKTNSSVTFSGDIVFDYLGSASTFVIVDGGSISRENISIVGYKDAKITYDNNIIGVSGLDAGVYNLTVSTNPDSNHNSVNASINVIVNKISSEIKSYNTIVFNYLNVGSTYITVNGGTLSNTKMEVVNHREANIKYNNNQIKVSNLNPGTYSLRVESIPDKNHNVEVRYIAVTVNKAPVRIIPSDVKLFQLNKGGWAVKVVDSENRPVSGIMVTLKVYTGNKFKTVNVVTNAKGEASYSVRGLSKGTHKVVLSISHNGYSANPVTSSIKVIKPTALKFKVNRKESRESESTITFQILNKKTKKGVNGIKVKLMIKSGKKYKTFVLKSKTVKNKKGKKVKGVVGVITNEFSAGKHKVIIMPVSIKYSGSGKSNIVIKKSATKRPPKTIKT